jgi:uncharacterized protein YbbK (DUF523 family)
MEKILVSSCLLGNKVRYNRSSLSIKRSDYDWLSSTFQIVPFCPEVSAGLPTPRAPAEIIFGSGDDVLDGTSQIFGENGVNFTTSFLVGAKLALEKCESYNIKLAVLTENSPSCGSTHIYNGKFKGIKKRGRGVASALLVRNGVTIYNQHNIYKLRSDYEERT